MIERVPDTVGDFLSEISGRYNVRKHTVERSSDLIWIYFQYRGLEHACLWDPAHGFGLFDPNDMGYNEKPVAFFNDPREAAKSIANIEALIVSRRSSVSTTPKRA